MNDKALEHAYKLFVDDGYTHGPEDFKKLIESNPAALNRSYELFKGDGYIHGIDNFKSLVGVEAAKQEKPGMLSNIASGISDFFSSDNEDLKKKDEQDISGSSLAESSSALSSKPKTPFEIAAAKARGEYIAPTGDLQEQIKAASKSGLNESYMGAEVPYEQTYAAKHKEEVTQETASNKKFSNDFTSQEDFKKSMGEVNKDLIDRDEGDATTRLKYLFGDYGFKFDKAGAGYDAIKVTAPNGKVLDLSIDRFTDKGDIESSNELKSFIDSNKPKINKVVSEYDKYYKKYTNQKEVDESLSSIRKDQSALREEQKNLSIDIIKTKAQEEELKKNPNPEMLSQLYEKKQEIAKRAAALEQKQSLNKTNDDRLNEAVGKYVKSTSDQGTWYGAIGSKLLDGVMQSEYTLMDYFQYGFKKLGSDKMLYGKDADKMTEKEKDEAFKKAADMTFGEGKKITKEITSLGVSKGYVEDASKNAIYRNALGIAEFIPAIGAMTANPVAGYTAFFASGYDGATEEMQNSAAFDDVPKGEQVVMATALGIANAAIMKIAPTSKFMESAAGKSMVANIIKRMGSEASAKTMQEFADNEVQSALNRGLIVAGANAAHGFATGVELKLSGDAVKEIYNTAKGEDKFQFPDNAKDYIQQVFESGVDMAIGGAMMGGFNILGTAYRDKNFNGVSDAVIDHYKSLTNPDILSAYEQKLDIAVSNGDITESKKQETLNDAKMSIGILEKMPDDLSAPQKRKSFSLIKERDELQQSIEGKDANLVKPQKTRIQEINSELEEIAAAKNAAPAEVPATAAEAQVAAKPKTFDEYSDEVKLELQYFLDNEEGYLKQEEQYVAQRQEFRKSKGLLERITSAKPSTKYLDKARSRVEMLKNNPEQYINDEINKYEKYKEEEGEDFENQNHLDYLKETQSKLQEENAVQKPTTEEGVLRTEQPEVGLPTMGEGNAQETTTQEGVTPAKPQEVKPIEQELSELEQMFPTEGHTGENKGVAASDTKAMEEIASRSTDERVQKVVKTAQRLTKTLKSLIPTADIHLHETDESYNGAMEQLNGNKDSDGHFIMGKNADGKSVVRIDINLSRATPVVVAHEVAHVILQKAFGNNQKLFQSFQEKIAKVLSTDSNQKLLDFANQDAYKEGGVTYEEYMVQLKALLSEQGTKLELSTAKKIAAVINEYVSKITKGAFKPFQEITDVKQVVDFVNKVTEAMAKGEAIDVEAAGKMGKGSRSSLREREITMPDGTKETVKPVSPKIVDGFYSPLEKSILNLKASKWGNGEQVLNELKKAGAKPDEFKWTGMEEWLSQQGKVSKDDILNFLDNNRVEILEVVKKEPRLKGVETFEPQLETKFSEYQLEGKKENYKEVLVTMPNAESRRKELVRIDRERPLTESEQKEYKELVEATRNKPANFQSSHFDESNILVHLRMNTRTDADGNKVLFLEEVQSDWGQKGRESGFKNTSEQESIINKSKEKISEYNKSLKELGLLPNSSTSEIAEFKKGKTERTSEINKEINKLEQYKDTVRNNRDWDAVNKEIEKYEEEKVAIRKEIRDAFNGIEIENEKINIAERSIKNANALTPQAPFVTDTKAWTKLGLKTAIKEAIKQGVDRIAWTTGEQQVKRYDLRKQIDEIEYRYDNTSDTYKVTGVKNKKIEFTQSLKESALESNLGKDVAQKIISNKNKDNWNLLQGEDLKVGGSGMKSFYDNIVPSAAKSLVKEITGKDGVITETKLDNGSTQQSIEITPELKQKVETEGLPLFSRSSLRTAEQVDKMVKDARASGYSEKAIEEFLKKRGVDQAIVDKSLGKKEAGTKIVANEEMMPGYDKMMEDVNSEILRGLDRKTKETTIEKNVMKIVEGSEAYKNATDQQKEQMTRDVKEAFGEKMKQAPSAEKVLGKKKTMITVDEAQARNAQIKLEMKAALEGAKSVTEKIKAVKNYFDSVKDSGNLTRKDLTRVMAAIAKVKDEKTLDKAVNKINDIIDNATSDKIEISEKKMLQNTIKEVKLAKGNIKEKRKLITDVIEGFKKLGKLTVNQVNALLKKANNLNVENFEHLAKFIDYAEKIFADAEYEKKLSDAFGKKKSLAKLSESKAKNATLKKLAKDFVNIDPSLVKDIDQYNKIAGELKEAITGSSATRGFVDTVDAALVSKYVDQILKEQHEKVTEMMREQMQELFGVDASTFSYEDMIKAMESTKEDMSEQNEKIVRSAAMKLFDMYSTIIDHMLRTGKDPFTGEDVNIKKSKEDLIKSFMDIDLTKLKIKDAIRAVDALKNFVVNGSTGGMLKVVNEYSGAEKSKEALKNGVKAGVLKVYNTEKIARLLFEYLTPYPVLMDALFGGVGKASYMEKMLGTTSLISNKSKAQKISNNYTDEYVNQFYKQKPNDTAFNTSLNNIERGMLAFVSRAEIGSDAQTKESFEDRKGLIEKSIEVLTNGVESQRKKGEEYQEIYDRILKDSKTAEEVRSKADAINAEAVDYWIEKWGDHYEEMSDIQENIHNTILGKEAFFTPDQYSLLGPEEGLDAETKNEPDITGSAFTKNSKAIYKKKTGRLEERTVKNILPKGKYVDLSFDNNNSNLMLDALIDIKTAGDIIHIDSFLKDDSFKKIMPRAEERELLNRRINLMVLNFRNKNHYDYDEMKKFSKSLNRIGAFGASMVLTSTGQPIKQAIPVAINTLANGVIPHFGVIKLFGHEFNKAKRDFMNRTGEGISLRGSESQTDIKGLDNLLKEAEEGNTGKFMQKLEEVNAAYLKNLLQKPDVYIAKAAWLGYYEKALKKQGIEVSDYSNHEVNKEAAQYASKMVDRQQNVSDADLKGKFFSDKHWAVQFISKTIMPFASFRINQWMRMNTDLGVLTKKTTTAEDRKNAALSLVGFGAEVAVFNAVGMALSQTIYNAAMSLMRSDDDSEEEKLQQEKDDEQYTTNLKKGKGNSLVQDIFSPAPPFDPAFELATYHLLNLVQSLKDIPEDERINIFEPAPKKTILKEFGTLGIAAERIANAQDIVEATVTGKIEQTNFGKKTIKNVRAEDKPLLKKLAAIAILNTTGVLPADFYTTQGYILKEITKNASTKTDTELAKEKRNKADTKKERIQKIRDLNNAIRESDDEEVTAGLLKMKREVQRKLHPVKMSDEAKEIIEKKKDREDRKLNILLSGYETKSDLKRYDPDLYEQNFGEQSDYYQAHTSEMKAESFYNKIKRKNLDEENNYSRPAKNKRKKSNSDGSKRAYYRYSGG